MDKFNGALRKVTDAFRVFRNKSMCKKCRLVNVVLARVRNCVFVRLCHSRKFVVYSTGLSGKKSMILQYIL